MNQILMVENKKKKEKAQGDNVKSIEIRSIVRFFAIVIMIFGLVLIGESSYAIYQEIEDNKPANQPTVTLSRLNDTAILYVEHTAEISKITYSWNDGEETVLPEGSMIAQEEILLPNQNSVLNIVIEDMNGKKVKYQKEYYLEGMDITKPTIKIDTANGSDKLTITATDETEMSYISYKWDGEEAVFVDATEIGQKEIVQEIELVPGTKKLSVIAEDSNGNVEKVEKEIVTTTGEPQMQLKQTGNQIIIEASDEDGIKDITLNLNGKKYAATDLNLKYVQVGPVELQEGNNTVLVEVTNVSGYTKKAATELQYVP